MTTDDYRTGDRVRLICSTPAAYESDEATVHEVVHNADGSIKGLVVLVDSNPATTHGTTVFLHEVVKISSHN